ncbi:MAG: hypothetical protein A3I61_18600 [Acidobacteria bacterium RIFCSPLOWO2_02_FULL_68_18]|nr:MAG: hypothetical protein A3I61_18600 [Acidobacteria bacterium RIFCSPLOWO2_02_FULL_68_18]OFW48057.1 MAG: hypothetical protein A3G77_11215 [Acidobacteria bacterium RIFCSPLOWO2_12_FULL_68_19]
MVGSVLTLAAGAVLLGDHSWNGYHWARSSNPFTLTVVDSVTSEWDAYLNEAIADWTASSVLDLTRVAGKTGSRDRYLCSSIRGRVRVCNYPYGDTGWLGIARIWVNGVHITKAITAVNDTYFSTATYNTAPWRRLVMCQEVGHDFGLDHQDEIFDNVNLGSCMDYTSDPDGPPSNEHPNLHDYEQLETIYAHTDGKSATANGSAAGGSAPSAADEDDFVDPPAQWGRLVRSIAGGRVQVYERDLGGPNRVVTRVVWVQ